MSRRGNLRQARRGSVRIQARLLNAWAMRNTMPATTITNTETDKDHFAIENIEAF